MLYKVCLLLICTTWMSSGRRMRTAFNGFRSMATGRSYLPVNIPSFASLRYEPLKQPIHYRHQAPCMITRLDAALVNRGLCVSRAAAKIAVQSGLVKVNEVVVRKPSSQILDSASVTVSADSEGKVTDSRNKVAPVRGQGRDAESRGITTRKLKAAKSEGPNGTPRVCIIGTGLTGSLTCFHLRALMKKTVHIDVKDMARGVGGRMSTTRGTDEMKANTGAQYISYFSHEAADALEAACAFDDPTHGCHLDQVVNPLKRSTHFMLKPDKDYIHFLPRNGTNSLVKQFLYGGEPDEVAFQSRLQRIVIPESGRRQLVPLFETGGISQSAYDVIILAMPPKDILRFFNEGSRHDTQSQADLHSRTNRGRKIAIPTGHQALVLPSHVTRRLRTPSYIGRYSLALWFHDAKFIGKLWKAWQNRREPHAIIDAISPQQNVIVTQSTVEFWRSVSKSGRGGRGTREAARSALTAAMEELAGVKIPREKRAKLLNWRTSQVERPLGREDGGVVTAEGGRLIFTGDWCVESSFEGCNLAALKAAGAAKDAISIM